MSKMYVAKEQRINAECRFPEFEKCSFQTGRLSNPMCSCEGTRCPALEDNPAEFITIPPEAVDQIDGSYIVEGYDENGWFILRTLGIEPYTIGPWGEWRELGEAELILNPEVNMLENLNEASIKEESRLLDSEEYNEATQTEPCHEKFQDNLGTNWDHFNALKAERERIQEKLLEKIQEAKSPKYLKSIIGQAKYQSFCGVQRAKGKITQVDEFGNKVKLDTGLDFQRYATVNNEAVRKACELKIGRAPKSPEIQLLPEQNWTRRVFDEEGHFVTVKTEILDEVLKENKAVNHEMVKQKTAEVDKINEWITKNIGKEFRLIVIRRRDYDKSLIDDALDAPREGFFKADNREPEEEPEIEEEYNPGDITEDELYEIGYSHPIRQVLSFRDETFNPDEFWSYSDIR